MAGKFKSFSLNAKEKKFCLELAKKSIEYSIKNNCLYKLSESEVSKIPNKLLEQKACFVTLMSGKELRGCIGHLTSFQPLYKEIIENSYAAAFSDNRFISLRKEELPLISIEISVLTDPIGFDFSTPEDLLKKISPKKDGLIISKGFNQATFLPSVWDQLPKKEDFLRRLCLKAGLNADEWQKPGLRVKKYFTIKIK
jgi:AmmeMemoRadiSam system protein A